MTLVRAKIFIDEFPFFFAVGYHLQGHQTGEHPGGRIGAHRADGFRAQQGATQGRQRTKGVFLLRHHRVHGARSGQGWHPGTRYRKCF